MREREEVLTTIFHTGYGGDTMVRCLVDFVMGGFVGEGCERGVFNFLRTTDTVIKVAPEPSANWLEWEIWNEVKGTIHEKWFAPCLQISPCGCFLTMKKTEPLEVHEYPILIPSYMGDTHSGNWGKINGVAVCHDYANNNIMKRGLNNRLIKAKFR